MKNKNILVHRPTLYTVDSHSNAKSYCVQLLIILPSKQIYYLLISIIIYCRCPVLTMGLLLTSEKLSVSSTGIQRGHGPCSLAYKRLYRQLEEYSTSSPSLQTCSETSKEHKTRSPDIPAALFKKPYKNILKCQF
jgi:hypothetical protein